MKYLGATVCLALATAIVYADAAGSATWNDVSISYKIVGDDAGVSVNSADDRFALESTTKGTKHLVTISKGTIEWNGVVQKVAAFKNIDILIEGKGLILKADGKTIFPVKNDKKSEEASRRF